MANAFRARKATRAAPQFGKRPDLANRYSKLLEIVLLHFLPNFLDGKSFGQLLEMLLVRRQYYLAEENEGTKGTTEFI